MKLSEVIACHNAQVFRARFAAGRRGVSDTKS
jgi:hypothetical protein